MICQFAPFLFLHETATTEIYTLSLHDALPIWALASARAGCPHRPPLPAAAARSRAHPPDRKSTRLNSSHANISYAVFCLKKKNDTETGELLRSIKFDPPSPIVVITDERV